MSVKVSGWVWELDLPHNEKLVLLAYADKADHDGGNIFPSQKLVAEMTGYSRRQVITITQRLIERGILIPQGINDKYATNQYSIPVPPYVGGEETSHGTSTDVKSGYVKGEFLEYMG